MQPRRNRPGSRLEDWYSWQLTSEPEINPKSSLALKEYLQHCIYLHSANNDQNNPITVNDIVKLPNEQDPDVWQYEQLRQICQDLGQFVALLEPECTPTSCPEMKADEWLYLCAAHPQPNSCRAFEYMIHTLDGATALLCSDRYFPSRGSIKESSLRHYQAIARRLYRIFAHAWFHHRELFSDMENETRLYARFLAFATIHFKLVPDQLVIIPNSALGDVEIDVAEIVKRDEMVEDAETIAP
ncbi:hypothetical protein HK098_001428 [Nowakowskiella sp. JEL0407]|nr:hypothetical protein HK098_001428 [Nowakowskiella sp. JEL0407]